MTHNDGIRVTPETPWAEEFHPDAFDTIFNPPGAFETIFNPRSKVRPQSNKEHFKLMEKELEDASAKIRELENELDENDYSSVEVELRLRNIIDHQDRGIQVRQMHLTTALEENKDLLEKNKTLEKRVRDVRLKALNRKFQSRFWMIMFALSMLEHIHRGVLLWIGKNIIMPVTTDVLLSDNSIAITIRTVAFMAAIGYWRVDRLLLKIPHLV